MGISINQVIENRKVAINAFKKIRLSLTGYLFYLIFALLFLSASIAIYSSFLVTYKLYELSFFAYFIYPIIVCFWLVIFGLISYFLVASIKSKIEFQEVSNIVFSKKEINKIFNPFWLLIKIVQINMIIKELKNPNPNPQDIVDLID